MVRLQRVTFTALHQYLGLSAELVNQGLQKKKQSPFSGSPVRSRTKENFSAQNTENQPNASASAPSEQYDRNDNSNRDTGTLGSHQTVPIVIGRRYVKHKKIKRRIHSRVNICNILIIGRKIILIGKTHV